MVNRNKETNNCRQHRIGNSGADSCNSNFVILFGISANVWETFFQCPTIANT
jgi:hypothetical protein